MRGSYLRLVVDADSPRCHDRRYCRSWGLALSLDRQYSHAEGEYSPDTPHVGYCLQVEGPR